VELSAADADKWTTLLKHLVSGSTPTSSAEAIPTATEDYELVGSLRQRQKRLRKDEIDEIVRKYQSGQTTQELAREYGCHNNTVSGCLKSAGVTMRLQPPSAELIDQMVRLYESGMSLAQTGQQVGVSAQSVLKYVHAAGVVTRDVHGRERSAAEC